LLSAFFGVFCLILHFLLVFLKVYLFILERKRVHAWVGVEAKGENLSGKLLAEHRA